MEKFTIFVQEEDDFLRENIHRIKISRLSIRLNRPYYMVAHRCVFLQLLEEKDIGINQRYYTQDEVDYNLLKSGCTEEEIRKLRGTRIVSISIKDRNSGS